MITQVIRRRAAELLKYNRGQKMSAGSCEVNKYLWLISTGRRLEKASCCEWRPCSELLPLSLRNVMVAMVRGILQKGLRLICHHFAKGLKSFWVRLISSVGLSGRRSMFLGLIDQVLLLCAKNRLGRPWATA